MYDHVCISAFMGLHELDSKKESKSVFKKWALKSQPTLLTAI